MSDGKWLTPLIVIVLLILVVFSSAPTAPVQASLSIDSSTLIEGFENAADWTVLNWTLSIYTIVLPLAFLAHTIARISHPLEKAQWKRGAK